MGSITGGLSSSGRLDIWFVSPIQGRATALVRLLLLLLFYIDLPHTNRLMGIGGRVHATFRRAIVTVGSDDNSPSIKRFVGSGRNRANVAAFALYLRDDHLVESSYRCLETPSRSQSVYGTSAMSRTY